MVLTLSASFLGAIIIAREWERGTLEMLSVTPASPGAILAAKFLVNFLLTAVGAMLAFFAAVFVFEVPVRGSLWLLAATILLYSAWAIAFWAAPLSRLQKSVYGDSVCRHRQLPALPHALGIPL